MSNLQKPERGKPIHVVIDGEDVVLRYSMGALVQLEEKHGISVLKPTTLQEMLQSTPKVCATLLAGLEEFQPQIDMAWIHKHVDATQLYDLQPYLLYAMTGRWPEDFVRKLEGPLEAPPESMTGSRSGASGDTTSDSPSATSGGSRLPN